MRTPKLIATGSVGINMTPMIDVTFLLIIFFLVSSHLSRQENLVSLELPKAESGLEDVDIRDGVVVNVMPDGTWMVAGVQIRDGELADILRRRQMDSADPLQLRIRTDRLVAYERIEPILNVAAQQGISDVVFSVYGEPQP